MKYRRKVITPALLADLERIFTAVRADWHCEMLEWNGEADPVHLLISAHPHLRLSDFVNNLKTASSRRVRRTYKTHIRRRRFLVHDPRIESPSIKTFSSVSFPPTDTRFLGLEGISGSDHKGHLKNCRMTAVCVPPSFSRRYSPFCASTKDTKDSFPFKPTRNLLQFQSQQQHGGSI